VRVRTGRLWSGAESNPGRRDPAAGSLPGDGILPAVSRRTRRTLPIASIAPIAVALLLLTGGALPARAQEPAAEQPAPSPASTEPSTDLSTAGADDTQPPAAPSDETIEQNAQQRDPRFAGAVDVPEPIVGLIDLGAPTVTNAQGPLFPLRRIVASLGGKLVELEESVTLELDDSEVIAGPGNPVMIVGREIVHLSQAPAQGEPLKEGLLVPLDFLRQSYGRFTDYEIQWSPATRRLTAVRRQPQVLPVTVDVVHLQGVSTVVLQFPERLDYRLEEEQEDIRVVPVRDRLEPAPGQSRVRDPLVRDVRVEPGRIDLDLAAGTTAESYTLEDPFRLVFDVVRGDEPSPPAPSSGSGSLPADLAEGPGQTTPKPPTPSRGLRTVVIDPGHGGEESGAVGPSGLLEKDLTLEIARTLRDRLRQRLPIKVVLTRNDDSLLPLDTRSAIANQNKADLFISIHLNSYLGAEARGAETYFLSPEASDSRAAETAELENAVGDGGDDEALYDLQLILWDLAQSYHLAASQRVANLIQEELNGALGLRDRGVKQAPFRVLMGAAMPAVLVELGFLSNPDEETKLRDPKYRADLVDALVRAIARFRSEVAVADGRLTTEPPPSEPATGSDAPAGAARVAAGGHAP